VKIPETDRYKITFDPTRHEMRNNEDDYLDKDGKMKKKSWEVEDKGRVRRKRGGKKEEQGTANVGCGSPGCGSEGHVHSH
jgi:hypothetical protein